jgi:hypothetical protein
MGESEMAVTLRFEILGPVRAYRDGEPVDVGPIRQQAVLALLLLNAGKPVPLDDMVAALWNGDPPEGGGDIVQRYIGALRRALDPDRTSLIALTDGGYVLRACENDAGAFRAAVVSAHGEHRTGTIGEGTSQLGRVLDRWRNEPLTGLTGPVFDAARARLNLERATATKMLAVPVPTQDRTPAPDRAPANTRPMAAELPPTRPFNQAPADPEYPEAVDPWDGHDLFPPDPLAMS